MNGLTTCNPTRIAVGVSGGADSMALMLLIDGWAKSRGGSALGITVDHGLRNGSSAEANQVASWLGALGINHKTIKWEGGASQSGGLQARARNARYELMADVCTSIGIKHLFVAHNMEDQAETFIMRLRHKSGLDGLGAMAKERKLDCPNCDDGITLVRPLLDIPKARLKDTLKARSQPWVEDPSNKNTAFERVRTREFLRLLEIHEGISPSRIAAAAGAARTLRGTLDGACHRFIENHVTHVTHVANLGTKSGAKIDANQFLALPEEIKRRVLARLIGSYGQKNKKGGYLPSAHKISRVLHWFAGKSTSQTRAETRTLGGCLISKKGDFLAIRPEPPRRKMPIHMVNNVTHEHLGQKSP